MPIKKAEDFVPSLYVINLIEKVLLNEETKQEN